MHYDIAAFARQFIAAVKKTHRIDASEVQYLERELTFQAETIIADYGPLKAEVLAPLNTETPPWAERVSHPVLSDAGRARIVANDATDIPVVGFELDDNESPLFTIAAAWLYNWLEELAPERINKLGQKRRATINAIARETDRVCMIGWPTANLGGFLNNPSVPVFTLPTGTWSTATPAQILADLTSWETFVIETSGEGGSSGTLYPNTLALPGQEVGFLHENAGVGTDSSIWQLWSMKQSQGVSEGKVERWELIRTSYADDVLGTRRGTMYAKHPDVLVCENPLPWEERAPQEHGLATKTPVVGRTGGVIWKKPAMAAYAAVG